MTILYEDMVGRTTRCMCDDFYIEISNCPTSFEFERKKRTKQKQFVYRCSKQSRSST